MLPPTPLPRRWRAGLAAVLVVVGAVGAVVVLAPRAPAPRPPAPGSPNFLLVVPDTLRADGLAHAPVVSELARSGVGFSAAISQSGWTLPALAALLTGRYPVVNTEAGGVGLRWIPEQARTVPTILGYYGYLTAVFWGPNVGGFIAPEFSTGFAEVHVEPDDRVDPAIQVEQWIGGHPREPFFAMVHNVDLQFVEHGAEGAIDRVYQREARTLGQPEAKRRAVAAYQANIARYDAAIGRMRDALEAAGLLDHTVIVVTSNHGLELGERAGFLHGTTSDTNLRVPLVISDPLQSHPVAVDAVVQTIDLAPTILARAGIVRDEAMAGQALQSLYGQAGAAYTERPVYSLCGKYNISVRTRRWKLSRISVGGRYDHLLFDLLADPGETRELYSQGRRPDGDLERQLDAFWDGRVAESSGNRAAWDAPLEVALRKFGYWGQIAGPEDGKDDDADHDGATKPRAGQPPKPAAGPPPKPAAK